MKWITVSMILFYSLPGFADWQLDNDQSSLHFVTTKATHVAEVHKFKQLSGTINNAGQAQLVIELSSVDTGIEIRDQRMKDILFEVAKYPKATFSTKVENAVLALKSGESRLVTLEGTLSVRGQSLMVSNIATVERLSDNRLSVSSQTPIVINAKDIGLVAGIEKLREVAGLPSISYSVVITYDLKFIEN